MGTHSHSHAHLYWGAVLLVNESAYINKWHYLAVPSAIFSFRSPLPLTPMPLSLRVPPIPFLAYMKSRPNRHHQRKAPL